MKNGKLYFRDEDSERCYTEDYFQREMIDEGLTEMEVFKAIPSTEKNYIFCCEMETCGEKSECNKSCDFYEQNGKSRICQHRGKLMDFGDTVILKLKL